MTTTLVSAPSAPAPVSSPTPAAASAPVSSAKTTPAAPKAASQPPVAPSTPQNVVKNPRQPKTGRDPNAPDPLRDAVAKHAAASKQSDSSTSDPATPVQSTPAKPVANPQDKARAALSTTGTTPEAPKPATQPAQVQERAPQDPMAELESLRRSNSEYGRKFKALDTEMADYRKDRESRAKDAEQAKLRPFEVGHPDRDKSNAAIARAEAYEAALSSIPEEQLTPQLRNAMAHRMGVTNEDMSLKNEFKAHTKQHMERMASDPSYMTSMIQKEASKVVAQVLERREQENQIRGQVREHLTDPVVQQFREAHPDDFRQALAAFDGNTEALANQVHMLNNLNKANAEKEVLTKRIAELEAKSGMVTEQQRLLRQKTTIVREPAGVQPVSDPLVATREWAKANNVPATITNHKFFAKLTELKALNGKQPSA